MAAGLTAAAALCGSPALGLAQPAPADPAAPATAAPSLQAGGAADILGSLAQRNTLLGDIAGLRPLLGRYGMTLTLQETSEVLGNVTGGIHTGFDYDGLTTATFQLDTGRAFGWRGGTFNASALQIHGRDLSADNLQTLQTASGIEADRATRLWELWYDQKFPATDRFDIKLGQQSLDQEFMVSQNALLYVNTAFGWAMVPTADLPGGGPAYPLSALGLRGRVHLDPSLTLLAGVFNGSPSPNNSIPDSQRANPSGTSFPLNGGTLAIAELQFAYPMPDPAARADGSRKLAGTYKIGLWYDSESFADQRYDNTGLPLASPATTGIPRQHRGNYGLYAVADQRVWQDAGDPGRNVGLFARVMGAPETNRNLIDFSLNAGINIRGPLPGRDGDTFGLAMGFATVSPSVTGLDRDTQFYTGAFTPARSSETYLEATYQYALTPWLQLQPDIQYVFNPGGGIANPSGTARVGDELVLGMRTNITF